MQQSVGAIICARCGQPIETGRHFAHYRWSGPGGMIEIAFHESCHDQMSDEEFSDVVDRTVEALLSGEPELFESEVQVYDEGEVPPDIHGATEDD